MSEHEDRKGRLERFRQRLKELGLEGALITRPENRRYLSGFTGSAGVLLVTGDRALIATDFRYYEQVERQCPSWELVRVTGGVSDALPGMLREVGVRRVGVESTHLTVEQWQVWHEVLDGEAELVPVKDLVEPLRQVKGPEEIEALRRAIACSDAAFEHLLGVLRPGMTEREVAWELESFMRTHGAERMAFPLIVGSGPNGAMPHATTSDRPIRPGEPIVIDFGAVVDGYHSDITRTVCLGRPDERFERVYALVLEAQVAAEERIRAGMTTREADAIARSVFEAAGEAEAFGHSLGHGVGLAIHEAPTVSPRTEVVLEPGMVFTVEPGLYYPGWGGVRIEDIVLLHEDGLEVLTKAPKEPIISL